MSSWSSVDSSYAPRGSTLYRALVDRQQVTTSCVHCSWSVTGSLKDTRVAFDAHRAYAHPEVVAEMPSPRALALDKAGRRQLSTIGSLPLRTPGHEQPQAA